MMELLMENINTTIAAASAVVATAAAIWAAWVAFANKAIKRTDEEEGE